MKKILVIEPDATTRNRLAALLTAANFAVLTAKNGPEGWVMILNQGPDLVLCDLLLPELDGFQLLRQVRQNPTTAAIPVIILTTLTDKQNLRRAMDLGADDYLPKPLQSQALLKAIAIRLAKQEAVVQSYNRAYQRATQRLQRLVYYDRLTNLPNRFLLQEQFHQLVTPYRTTLQDSATPLYLGVLCLGLDRFKRINRHLGPQMGDFLLQQVARRLQLLLGKQAAIARFNADQFAIILPPVSSQKQIESQSQQLLQQLSQPFLIDSQELFITASIGVSLYQQHDTDLSRLLHLAGEAMYQAKTLGGNCYHFYQPQPKTDSPDLIALESSLRRALENSQLRLYYQPQVNLNTGEVVGAEALIRWQHPDYGFVSPATFIPLAEESGLILPIGEWVLMTACEQLQQWQNLGYRHLRMGINISVRQFAHSQFCDRLRQTLSTYALSPESLELEVTESLLVQDPDRAVDTLTQWKELGIQIAIDDFGTGYSSLKYLQKFPFDTLKLDRCFVSSITTDSKNIAITTAIIQMARNLNLKLVAEGVETPTELCFLIEQECDEMQGYYFSPPIPASAFGELLQSGKRLAFPT